MNELADRLSALIDARAEHHQRELDYYSGDLPRVVLADRTLPAYRQIVDQSRTPWAALVVDQAAERLRVTGFRVVTPDAADADVEADALAWDVWQGSQAEMYSEVALTTMLLHGRAYVLVEEAGDGGLPVISFEHPSTTATLSAAGGRTTIAALKRWVDGDNDVAVVWTVGGAETLVRDRRRSQAAWQPAGAELASNRTGMVPVFELRNRPDLLGGASSDLDGLYPTLDRCAQSIADRVTTQLFAAVKVRYLTGVEPDLDEDGRPTEATLRLATDRLLLIESPEARAGVFEASDLRQFIETARSDVAALAALARLPSFLLSGDLVNVSREALESLSQGMVARVEQRQTWATPALSGAMRLALRLAGDDRVSDPRTRVEPIWAPALPPSATDTAQAASTLVQAGILSATAAADLVLGLTPTERDKVRQYRRSDALDSAGVADIGALFAEPAPAEA